MRAAMRTIYSAEMDETSTLYDDILNKKAILSTGSGQGYEGYTTQNGSGQRLIDLNLDGKSSLDLGVLLSHEAFRDGTTSGEFGQKMETRNAAMGHMNVASALQSAYGASYLNKGNNTEAMIYKQYEDNKISDSAMAGYIDGKYNSTQDYWKLMDNGTIAYDGKANLYDENGNIILETKSGGIQGSLQEILGITSNEAYDLMKSAGLETQEGATKPWLLDKNLGRAIGMDNCFMKDGQSITYADLYKSRVITDSTTGMTGTIFDQNPVNIYDKLVANGQMQMDNTGVIDRDGNWTGLQPSAITYQAWKANNYINNPEQVMKGLAFKEPLNGATVTSSPGVRKHPITGIVGTHTGYDYSAEIGTKFNPLRDGTVSDVGWTDYGGNTLTLEHEMAMTFKGQNISTSFFSEYLHMDSQNNSSGVPWESGDFLTLSSIAGYTGNSGPSSGPHLHSGTYMIETNPLYNWLPATNYWNYSNSRGLFFDYGEF